MLEKFERSLNYMDRKSLFCLHEALLTADGVSCIFIDKYARYKYKTIVRGYAESDESLVQRAAKECLDAIIELTCAAINELNSEDITESLRHTIYTVEDKENEG